jgi:hypothetical protein
MAATAIHRLTLDPMGKCSNAFLETTNMIKAKLYMNVHWTVLYNLKVFCSDIKFKMAATAGLSLTLDVMGKMFQNASSLKPLGQLKPNCPGMIIGRSSTKILFFYADRKFKMAGHFEVQIGTKNVKFAEDHPMNIRVQFGFNHICSF